MYRIGIITASDKGARGEREDISGKIIGEIFKNRGYEVLAYKILSDDEDKLYEEIVHMTDKLKLDLILTTGGTGFSPRDVTPEATRRAVERLAPGISEGIRAYSLKITPKAILSRGVSGIRKNTLIINLPGSPKAVRESLDFLLDPLEHGLNILTGKDIECAR